MPTFTLLKKIPTILLLLFLTTATANAQFKVAERVVRFYPNPASEVVYFELPTGYDNSYSLLLFNFMGKKVREAPAVGGRNQVMLDGFYRGVYIYQLRDRYGKIIDSGRFQIVR